MSHFVVGYVHQEDIPAKKAAESVRSLLKTSDWEGKLTIRAKAENPWVQVEGFWPNDAKEIGRILTTPNGQAVTVEEETVSGYVAYSRFRNGKYVFHFMKCEDQRELKGKPLPWEQTLFTGNGDNGVYDLRPIAKQLDLPGFVPPNSKYWSIEIKYAG